MARGSCNCGGVKYRDNGPLDQVVACHCTQCRKQTGHFYAATNAADTDLVIEDSGSLKWYAASDIAKRGFCGNCGSALFWRANGDTKTSILAGTLDEDDGVRLGIHIFCEFKGDYYDIDDGLPQFSKWDRS